MKRVLTKWQLYEGLKLYKTESSTSISNFVLLEMLTKIKRFLQPNWLKKPFEMCPSKCHLFMSSFDAKLCI